MHFAKGLEIRAVAVMADDEVIPLQQRIEAVTDDGDLEEVYNTERHSLYVGCRRARDYLLVTCVAPGSEFLDDLLQRCCASRFTKGVGRANERFRRRVDCEHEGLEAWAKLLCGSLIAPPNIAGALKIAVF